jgi:hypothetical protein
MLLPIFDSKLSLSTRFADYSNFIFLPAICLFGLITNLIDVLVTLSIRRRDNIVKYILVNSLFDISILLTQTMLIVIRCGVLCPYGYTYLAKIYDLFIYNYLRFLILSFQGFFNFYFNIQNVKLFASSSSSAGKKEDSFNIHMSNRWMLLLFVTLSFLLNTPVYFVSREVRVMGIYRPPTGLNGTTHLDEILYKRAYKNEWNSGYLQAIVTIFIFLKTPFIYIMTGVVNILVAIKFHQFITKKSTILNTLIKGLY